MQVEQKKSTFRELTSQEIGDVAGGWSWLGRVAKAASTARNAKKAGSSTSVGVIINSDTANQTCGFGNVKSVSSSGFSCK